MEVYVGNFPLEDALEIELQSLQNKHQTNNDTRFLMLGRKTER